MRMWIGLCLLLLPATAEAQVTPSHPTGSDVMSRSKQPEATSQSAPEASSRSDSSTSPGARESEINRRNMDPPNSPGTRPDQRSGQ